MQSLICFLEPLISLGLLPCNELAQAPRLFSEPLLLDVGIAAQVRQAAVDILRSVGVVRVLVSRHGSVYMYILLRLVLSVKRADRERRMEDGS